MSLGTQIDVGNNAITAVPLAPTSGPTATESEPLSVPHAEQLTYNWHFAKNFPEHGVDEINRANVIETIIEILSGDTTVVFLEGDAGDGATTTLAQFCRMLPNQCFSLFIKPVSRFSYSLDYLRTALAEQLYWYSHGVTLPEATTTAAEFAQIWWRARGKQRAAILYFVVDGIHQIPKQDHRYVVDMFRDLLPIGVDKCRFIITGQQTSFDSDLPPSLKAKPFRQLKFSIDESRAYLSSAALDEADLSRVHQVCRGVPGRMAVVKRLLLSGRRLDAILDSEPAVYLEFVNLELAALDAMDEQARQIVGAVAFSKYPVCVVHISELLSIELEKVRRVIANCHFLTVTGADDEVNFISVSHQKCAEKRLSAFEQTLLQLQVDYLRLIPRTTLALRFLPSYYETLNEQEAILELLSKDHYNDLLSATHSYAALRSRAELGAKSAQALERTHELFKFSVQRSIFNSVGSFDGSEAQIEALVAMGRPEIAFSLANSAAAKEDRLALLAALARRYKERGTDVPRDLLTHIKDLVSEVKFNDLGDEAVEIAANVMIFDPDLAIGIIESAVKGASDNVRDSALAEMSLSASFSKLQYRTQFEDKASPKISDAALQRVTNSFAALAAGLEVSRLTGLLVQMPVSHRMYFLRSFVKERRDDPNILDLVEFGLDTIVKESAYTPRLIDLAELALPLTAVGVDKDRLQLLVPRFDSQMGLVARSAQSKELVRLQMRLAAAELRYDFKRGCDRIEQVIYSVLEVQTPEVQLECWGLLLRALGQIDSDGRLEHGFGFRALVKRELSGLLQSMLKDTAEQLLAISPMLSALAADDADAAITIAESLNTESRRDKAFELIARVISTLPHSAQQYARIDDSLSKICDSGHRADAALSLLGPMRANPQKLVWIEDFGMLRRHLIEPRQLGAWDTWTFKSLSDSDKAAGVVPFVARIEQSCDAMHSSIDRSNLCFNVAEALADCDRTRSTEYYEHGLTAKNVTGFNTLALCRLLELALSLVSRSFAALAKHQLLDEDKLQRFGFLVNALPSISAKVRAYADLAERLWCAGRIDMAAEIARTRLHPLLTESEAADAVTNEHASVVAFPALSVWHLETAMKSIASANSAARDTAIHEACMLRLRKLPSTTADGGAKIDSSKLEPDEVTDVVSLLDHVATDSMLFTIMDSLFPILRDKRNRTKFTRLQKSEWSLKCRLIINRKLPDSRNITHRGFYVVCTALTYSIEDSTTFQTWEQLARDANLIDNIADKSYVFLKLASCLPTKYEPRRNEHLKHARELISRIPSPLDRLSHLQDYAETAHSNNAKLAATATLREAMQLSLEIENNSRTARHRRELIDLADRIDSKLADELIDLIDDDPARALLKADAKRAGSVAKARRELADAKQFKDAANCRGELLPQAAWKNLAALEAGRLDHKPIDVMMEYVVRAGGSTLQDAFPVLSWHIANLELKCKNRAVVATQIAPVCESLLLTTEIAASIVSQAVTRPRVVPVSSENAVFVGRNDKESAIEFIATWLSTHAVEHVTYCDMYFSSKDVGLLRLFLANAPDCGVRVITSKKYLMEQNEQSDEPFRAAWAAESDQSPPETQVIAIGQAKTNASVVHDRWLITKGAGLRFGSSWGGLGGGKASEISVLDASTLAPIQALLEQYVNGDRLVAGAKMQYHNFTID